MRNLLVSLLFVAASAAPVRAQELSFPSLKDLRAAAAQTPSLRGSLVGDSIAMFPMAGKNALVGYATSEAEYKAAVARWTGVLAGRGIKTGAPTWQSGVYVLPYAAPYGRVIRRFAADPRQFAPKDPTALLADRRRLVLALSAHGLPVVAAPAAHVEGMLPTYYVYFLARGQENEDKEIQARVLFREGDDIDYALLEKAGVSFVEKPQPWLGVYIGPRLSFVSFVGDSKQAAQKKLDTRLDYLRGQGLTIIGTKLVEDPAQEPQYRWVGQVYFYL